ncbi:hypothetical protein LCGC14_2524800, partial [marine sediment metagenome]
EWARVNDLDSHAPRILETPPISADIWADLPLIERDWQQMTGRSSPQLLKQTGGTATEASFAERASNLIDADMQDGINDWLSMAGQKMLQRIQATLTIDMWIKMRGFSDKEFTKYLERTYGIPQEATKFFPGLKDAFKDRFGEDKPLRVTREDLQFQSVVSVIPGSARPRNLDTERHSFLTFVSQILGPFPQIALSPILLERIMGMFEINDARLVEELHVLGQKMVEINARQAGRNQGDQAGAGGDGQGQILQNLLAAATQGRQQ